MRQHPTDPDELAALIEARLTDPVRVEAVHATGLMDLPVGRGFDRISNLAQALLGASYGFISIIDEENAGWLATVGTKVEKPSDRTIPAAESMAQYVVAYDDAFLVSDVEHDERVELSDTLRGYGVRSWAGVPLRDQFGNALGAVGVSETATRDWTETDVALLKDLAQIATDEITAGKTARDAARSEAVLNAVLARAPIGVALVDSDFRYEIVNETLAEINGMPVDDHIGRTMSEVVPDVADAVMALLRPVFETGEAATGVEVSGRTAAAPDVERTWSGSYYRIELADGPRVGIMIEDITDRAAARRRALSLARIAEALAKADSFDDIAEVVNADVAAYFDAMIAIVGLWDAGSKSARFIAADGIAERVEQATYDIDDDAPYALAARTRQIVTVGSPAERAERFTSDVGAALVAEAVVPCLTSDGSLVGSMTIGWNHPMAPDDFPIPQLQTVGGLIGSVVERTRLHRQRRELITELQNTLLSPPCEQPNITTAVRYEPAEDATGLGGDWFDVVAIDEHRTGLVVGDVVGHGPSAAARMSQIGSTIAQLLILDTPLDRVFSEAERVLSARSIDTMATVAVIVADTQNRTLTSISAGHLPAILVHPGGETETLEPALRPPLCTYDRPVAPTAVAYEPGTKVVLFTDGLIETKDGDIDTDMARLLGLTNAVAGLDIEQLLDRLVSDVTRGRTQFDDLAALAAELY
jgi:GAF domain-containing protein